ncbi:DegT/DnrJ/EryC1/StrS family aminotransferase [Flavobacterium amniphilum]|uniref:DegT/DnrJ/EryC1/StrS family aminotransferase n=1 Tax=Flavobacterium amniphilum TaxID=1834035 RepID=UPI00202A2E8D|nr:DegT/DnrJ/EryC1/StrS family aminotransferase [Flavobacterium amniphilum]MCL9805625.1 DegT/DnrJ/EryC1/StrS family aminotransferase [Flavobacterium amniphilum]
MISFLDLKKINQRYEVTFQEKLKTVMDKGWYVLGEEVETFERSFADYCGSKYCVGVANGLDAITLSFLGYIETGVLQKGDEIIVPANTYIASILGIIHAGLVPVLVEPLISTYNIDPAKIEEKISEKTKGILIVHLYGQLADMDSIMELGYKYDLLIVEDAAQGHGLPFKGSHTRTFSFYPGKNLGALGDGGAVVTNDEKLAKVLQRLRNYGSDIKYYNESIGFNSRLDELQTAFLNVKLADLNTDNEKRRSIAKRYITEIRNEKIVLPEWDFSQNHVFHLFVIRSKNREELQEYLTQNGIQTLIHYPVPPHKQKALPEWNNLSFPITEQIHAEVLSLPMSPVLTGEEVDFVIETLNRY